MNWKWLGSVCIVVLACLGVNLKQHASPNQEIELQFQSNRVSSSEAYLAITHIKQKLQSIGIEDIQVVAVPGEPIKITYFSTIDVSFVKGLFTVKDDLIIDFTSPFQEKTPFDHPFSKEQAPYELQISEISKESSNDLGLNGVLIDIKYLRDQYLNHFVYGIVSVSNFSVKNSIETKINNLHYSSVVIIENTSYKIPEVRAGPLS